MTLRVLISEPPAQDQLLFHPYVWAVLKSHAEREGDLKDAICWLPPIYRKDAAEKLLEPYRAQRVDVLGLSCYTWNWHLQRQIARNAKAIWPECLIVAGGPDPDYKNPAFFEETSELDMVVVKDGEIPFARILRQLSRGSRDFTGIPGLYLPGPKARAHPGVEAATAHVFTGPAETPARFTWSPYLDQRSHFEELTRQHGPGTLNAIWETNRGCPYGCTYCDWGSSTLSKIRPFDLDLVREEADWLARIGTKFIFLTDANFGILPRDIEIADWINAAHDRHGFPGAMYYSPAKNNPERSIAIARRFARSGISAFHTLAIQHTDETVLACVDRSNIKPARQREVVRALLGDGVPVDTHLIIGMPGDTLDKWKTCLATVMEWGIHQEYIVFPFCLLPNAPAAEPAYLERFQVKSVERLVAQHQGLRAAHSLDSVLRSRVVISTRTYSVDDWVEMRTYTAFVQALHNCALTRLVAVYLRFTHDVPYDRFYRAIIDDWCAENAWLAALKQRVADCFSAFVKESDAVDDIAVEGVGSESSCLDPSRYVFLKVGEDLPRFYAELKTRLAQAFPDADTGRVIDYQQNAVIDPGFDSLRGRAFRLDRDWPAYFERALRLTDYEPLPEPERLVRGAGVVRDNVRFIGETSGERTRAWLEATVLFRRANANFARIEALSFESLASRAATRSASV